MILLTLLFFLISLTLSTPLAQRTTPPDTIHSNRRGLAYNNPAYAKFFNVPGSHVQWCYNWDSTTGPTNTPFEYVAMLHSNRPYETSKWEDAVKRSAGAQKNDPTHLLAFNEPDNCQEGAGGSCMFVGASVEAWWKYMEPAKKTKDKMYLGSPAVTNGGTGMGLDWLKKFFELCVGCSIDFICVHWYDSATNFAAFKAHIEGARRLANGRPIWVTEFAATGSDEEIKSFLNQAIPYMDSSKDVARYAYFMGMPGSLLKGDGSGLSEIGRHFVYWRTEGDGFSVEAPEDGRKNGSF